MLNINLQKFGKALAILLFSCQIFRRSTVIHSTRLLLIPLYIYKLTLNHFLKDSSTMFTTSIWHCWSAATNWQWLLFQGSLVIAKLMYYRIAPNFRGIIFSWISWFDFWSQKFSSRKFSMLMVGVAMCCAAQRVLACDGGYSEHKYVHACTCNVLSQQTDHDR